MMREVRISNCGNCMFAEGNEFCKLLEVLEPEVDSTIRESWLGDIRDEKCPVGFDKGNGLTIKFIAA